MHKLQCPASHKARVVPYITSALLEKLLQVPFPVKWRAVASWFVTLIRMHMHAGSNPDWGTVRTGPLASLLTLSFFVLSRQCLKMRVLGVDVET